MNRTTTATQDPIARRADKIHQILHQRVPHPFLVLVGILSVLEACCSFGFGGSFCFGLRHSFFIVRVDAMGEHEIADLRRSQAYVFVLNAHTHTSTLNKS